MGSYSHVHGAVGLHGDVHDAVGSIENGDIIEARLRWDIVEHRSGNL